MRVLYKLSSGFRAVAVAKQGAVKNKSALINKIRYIKKAI